MVEKDSGHHRWWPYRRRGVHSSGVRSLICDLEIAHIGLQQWEAPQGHCDPELHRDDAGCRPAITDGEDTGFVKIHIAEGIDRILGATIVASRASELINEMAVIMSAGIGMTALAEMVHTYPARSDAIMLAAQAWRHEFDKAVRAASA